MGAAGAKRGDLIKVVWHDGHGACLFTKRLEGAGSYDLRWLMAWFPSRRRSFPILLSGIDWRAPQETWRPSRL
ncbi:MAG: hypothetical protein EOP14_01985 [Pseudomonas sp.]|nr:MAG: hypothetical protein EOP14_01985 [Pseudomonas sp.]